MVEILKQLASRPIDDLEHLPDTKIVQMARQELPHDLTAYRELLRRYEGLVYHTCYKLLNSAEDAQEVSQDALLQVFHKLDQFEGRSSFKTWLYKIVHNYCHNRLRKIVRRRQGRKAYEGESLHDDPSSQLFSSQDDLSEKVQEALDKLKEKEREVIVLKFISGLTLEEISTILNLGLSATKMRLYRSLDAFKIAYHALD